MAGHFLPEDSLFLSLETEKEGRICTFMAFLRFLSRSLFVPAVPCICADYQTTTLYTHNINAQRGMSTLQMRRKMPFTFWNKIKVQYILQDDIQT